MHVRKTLFVNKQQKIKICTQMTQSPYLYWRMVGKLKHIPMKILSKFKRAMAIKGIILLF